MSARNLHQSSVNQEGEQNSQPSGNDSHNSGEAYAYEINLLQPQPEAWFNDAVLDTSRLHAHDTTAIVSASSFYTHSQNSGHFSFYPPPTSELWLAHTGYLVPSSPPPIRDYTPPNPPVQDPVPLSSPVQGPSPSGSPEPIAAPGSTVVHADTRRYLCLWDGCRGTFGHGDRAIKNHFEEAHPLPQRRERICHWDGCEMGNREVKEHTWRHLRSHAQIPAAYCQVCGKIFQRMDNAERHYYQHHGNY